MRDAYVVLRGAAGGIDKRKIRNPNIEIRNKFKIQMIQIQNKFENSTPLEAETDVPLSKADLRVWLEKGSWFSIPDSRNSMWEKE